MEDHLLELVLEGDGAADDLPAAVRTSTSLMASSAALSTIRSTVSCTVTSIATVPEKVADPTSGSISMR